MEELNIKIQELENEIMGLENRIDSYTNYNRTPDKKERYEQLKMLGEWRDYNLELKSLIGLRDSILSNLQP